MRNRPIYDVVALLARCAIGVVFLAHGWQKIQVGVNATGKNLDAMGVPLSTAAAVYSTFVELLGGAALILGLALPVAGTLLFLDMAGAVIFVHGKHGIFLVDGGKVHNGFELVLVLGVAAALFAAGAGGRLTLDHRIFGRDKTDDEFESEDVPPWRALPAPSTKDEPAGPVPPDADDKPKSGKPRLAADIVTDTSRDVIVAGKKKTDPPADDKTTTPVRTRKRTPKSGS